MLGVDWELAERRATASSASSRGGAVGRRRPLAARRARRQRQGGRLRARRQRRAARHDAGSVGGFQGLGDKTVVLTVNAKPSLDGRARRCVVKCLADETELRFRAWIEERRQHRRRGDRRQRRLHLRAEHGRRRAERAGAPVHGAVEEGRAHHRRALEQRRPDSRSLHRAAEPADARATGPCATARAGSGRRSRTAGPRSC